MNMFVIEGGFNGLAASSRVRLARNLKGYPFRHLTASQYEEIAQKVFSALTQTPALSQEFEKKQIVAQSAEAAVLVERHLISPDLAQNGGWLICSKDRGVSIMIGEEDHLRLQVMGTGLCPKECLETAERLSMLIEQKLPLAFDEHLGYLTACPTNIGTGLRTSIMLHLPILTLTDSIQQMVSYAGRSGCAVRGAYGEGSEAVGGFYQISNQITLGASSASLTDHLITTATEIIEAEKKAREQVRTQNGTALSDRICRSLGAMQTARLMKTAEAITCISDVLVGLQMGLLAGVDAKALYRLEQDIRPALLGGSPAERDQKRADLMRETSKAIEIL